MNCPAFSAGGPFAIAQSLQSVDCMAGEATAAAFGRIFGSEGLLTGALTIALTLYVALFAIALLTGRSGLRVSTLTPRMIVLGLTLTFATSWVAYSEVVWSLLSAGPDWIASTILGIKGSATQAFAQRLDVLFQAVADAAEQARAASKDAKGTTPANLLSYAALLLLLGTVGVLVTSRIALAALLAAGPIFIIFSLFSGTRGLFEGWLKAAVMFALTPLFTVLIGVGAVAMLNPVVESLAGGEVAFGAAATVFVAAAIHCALMIMSLKLVSALTTGWRLPGVKAYLDSGSQDPALPGLRSSNTLAMRLPPTDGCAHDSARLPQRDDRVRAVVAAVTPALAPVAAKASGRLLSMPQVMSTGGALSNATASGSRARETGRGAVRPAISPSIKEILA